MRASIEKKKKEKEEKKKKKEQELKEHLLLLKEEEEKTRQKLEEIKKLKEKALQNLNNSSDDDDDKVENSENSENLEEDKDKNNNELSGSFNSAYSISDEEKENNNEEFKFKKNFQFFNTENQKKKESFFKDELELNKEIYEEGEITIPPTIVVLSSENKELIAALRETEPEMPILVYLIDKYETITEEFINLFLLKLREWYKERKCIESYIDCAYAVTNSSPITVEFISKFSEKLNDEEGRLFWLGAINFHEEDYENADFDTIRDVTTLIEKDTVKLSIEISNTLALYKIKQSFYGAFHILEEINKYLLSIGIKEEDELFFNQLIKTLKDIIINLSQRDNSKGKFLERSSKILGEITIDDDLSVPKLCELLEMDVADINMVFRNAGELFKNYKSKIPEEWNINLDQIQNLCSKEKDLQKLGTIVDNFIYSITENNKIKNLKKN